MFLPICGTFSAKKLKAKRPKSRGGAFAAAGAGAHREEWMKRICLFAAAATLFAAPAFAENAITVGFTASQTGPLNVDSLGQ